MLRITTLWFSESISRLSETDDVVHNVFLNTHVHEVLWRHSYRTVINLYQVLSLFQLKPTNPTSKH